MSTKKRVGVLELATHAPTAALVSNVLGPNLAGIMPQVIAVWAANAGHDVQFLCYTGKQKLPDDIPREVDVLFISAFTQSGQLAYAVASWARSQGIITVLGGPHARCYPDDACKHFDYVVGLCDEDLIAQLIAHAEPQRPGVQLATAAQVRSLPGVRERWPFLSPIIAQAPKYFRVVPMLASVGCPYTCSFCIDATVDYEALDLDTLKGDLRFLLETAPNSVVAWHDPNFGVRFEEVMGAIEEADPTAKIRHVAESSLALLAEEKVKRMAEAGFAAVLPGVESWFDLGLKAKTGRTSGLEKMERISDHLNTILKYMPYIQANFVLGMDNDEGPLPFELTKRFVDRSPGVFPGYSLLTAFGQASPLNRSLADQGRIRPFPFHFLNNNLAMNVKPRNYGWAEFYDHVIDVVSYTWAPARLARRVWANDHNVVRWVNLARGVSTEGWGRVKHFKKVRRLIDTDPNMIPWLEGERSELPELFAARLRKDLGPMYEWLPEDSRDSAPVEVQAAAK